MELLESFIVFSDLEYTVIFCLIIQEQQIYPGQFRF